MGLVIIYQFWNNWRNDRNKSIFSVLKLLSLNNLVLYTSNNERFPQSEAIFLTSHKHDGIVFNTNCSMPLSSNHQRLTYTVLLTSTYRDILSLNNHLQPDARPWARCHSLTNDTSIHFAPEVHLVECFYIRVETYAQVAYTDVLGQSLSNLHSRFGGIHLMSSIIRVRQVKKHFSGDNGRLAMLVGNPPESF